MQTEPEITNTPEPVKSVPTKQEIDDWNNYLKYFNEKVKSDGVKDEELDAGDGQYARNQFEQYNLLTGKNYNYDAQTKKMQEYYNNLYNSPDEFTASLVKTNYTKPELSKVDGRIGSYTRNYYVPTYNHSDNRGVRVQGLLNPYTQGIEVIDVKGTTPEEAQKIFKQSGIDFVSKKQPLVTASK